MTRSTQEMIFPLYCTDEFAPLYEQIASMPEPIRIFNITAGPGAAMREIPAGKFDYCKSQSFTYQMFERSYQYTFYAMISSFGLFLIFNIIVHMFSVNESKPGPLDKTIDDLLGNLFDERHYQQYYDAFQESFIKPHHLPRLTYAQLREIGMPVGHAMEMLDGIHEAMGGPDERSLKDHRRLQPSGTAKVVAHLIPTYPGSRTVATLLTAGSDHVFGRTNLEGIDVDNPPAGVSKMHMTFCSVGDAFELVDQGSRNGTFVNKQRVNGRAPLKHGDRIAVGREDAKLGYVYYLGAPKARMETKYPTPIVAGSQRSNNGATRVTEWIHTVSATPDADKV